MDQDIRLLITMGMDQGVRDTFGLSLVPACVWKG